MTDQRPGYEEGVREIGRRAASNGKPITLIDASTIFDAHDKGLWREGWREWKRSNAGIAVVRP